MTLEFVTQLFEVVLFPLLGALTTFAIKWLNAKTNEVKAKTDNDKLNMYIDLLAKTVTDCVIATNQTYVNSLKEQGSFDEKAQKKAFNDTYKAVMKILNEDAKTYLNDSIGDLEVYITKMIEAGVNEAKQTE